MKKLVFALVCALGISTLATAQTANEAQVAFDKAGTLKTGFTITYNNNVKDVNLAVANRASKDKLKGKGVSKGVTKFEAINYPTVCAQQCDLYIKVDGTDKTSTVTAFVSKGYDNFVTSANDAETANRTKAFLESLAKDIDAVALKNQIAAQEKVLATAEKTYKKQADAQAKAEKELENIKNETKKLDAERQNQKTVLDQLKEKLNNYK